MLNKSAKTLIITTKGNEKQFSGKHIEVVGCKPDNEGQVSIECALDLLFQRSIKKLLVEGGGTVIWNFLKSGFADDIYVYIGPYIIGGKNTPTVADGSGIKNEDELIPLKFVDVNRLGSGILIHYRMV